MEQTRKDGLPKFQYYFHKDQNGKKDVERGIIEVATFKVVNGEDGFTEKYILASPDDIDKYLKLRSRVDERLDLLLKFYKSNIPRVDILGVFREEELEIYTQYLISQKLVNDKNILTVDGLLFNGFVKNKNNERIKRFVQISYATLLLAGTLAAGIYGLFEIWKYYYGYVPSPCR